MHYFQVSKVHRTQRFKTEHADFDVQEYKVKIQKSSCKLKYKGPANAKCKRWLQNLVCDHKLTCNTLASQFCAGAKSSSASDSNSYFFVKCSDK